MPLLLRNICAEIVATVFGGNMVSLVDKLLTMLLLTMLSVASVLLAMSLCKSTLHISESSHNDLMPRDEQTKAFHCVTILYSKKFL